jgi:SAM-dependent methyltransferase
MVMYREGAIQSLNLGSAYRPRAGYVNLDMQALPGVDVVYEVDPWHPKLPFADESFSEIYANNFVEHVANTNALIQELWRVSVNGAHNYILTPGYRDVNSWRDPTHFAHWEERILDFYTRDGFDGRRYSPALLTYKLMGDNDHGLAFDVTMIKPGKAAFR